MEDAQLHFTREAILSICELAISMKTGARALRSIMENIMLDVMYDLPAQEEPVRVTITAAVVKGKGKAKLTPIPAAKRDAA